MLDDYIFIDNLSNLSFGFQSEREALESILTTDKTTLIYNKKKVVVKKDTILELYFEGKLDKDFYEFLKNQVEEIMSIWSIWDADFYVNETLPEIISERREYS